MEDERRVLDETVVGSRLRVRVIGVPDIDEEDNGGDLQVIEMVAVLDQRRVRAVERLLKSEDGTGSLKGGVGRRAVRSVAIAARHDCGSAGQREGGRERERKGRTGSIDANQTHLDVLAGEKTTPESGRRLLRVRPLQRKILDEAREVLVALQDGSVLVIRVGSDFVLKSPLNLTDSEPDLLVDHLSTDGWRLWRDESIGGEVGVVVVGGVGGGDMFHREDRLRGESDLVDVKEGVEETKGDLATKSVDTGGEHWVVRRHEGRIAAEAVEFEGLGETYGGGDIDV
jgi:hypothetical protein